MPRGRKSPSPVTPVSMMEEQSAEEVAGIVDETPGIPGLVSSMHILANVFLLTAVVLAITWIVYGCMLAYKSHPDRNGALTAGGVGSQLYPDLGHSPGNGDQFAAVLTALFQVTVVLILLYFALRHHYPVTHHHPAVVDHDV